MKAQVAAEAEEVRAAGGLYVLGTERHESRRIDNQLRGRSGRQGDPGESRFYLSLGDELMRRFNGQLVESIMNRFNLPDDVPIEAGMVTKAIRSAQTQVEQQNFEIRKNVLKYDEVLNKQRTVIYDERRRVLAGEDIGEQIEHMLGDVVSAYVDGATAEGYAEDWDLDKLWTALGTLYPIGLDRAKLVDGDRRRPHPRHGSPRPCSPTRARPTPGARPRSTPSSAGRAACVSWSGRCCCRSWTASGASTSTRWTTSRRASGCGRWRSATR